jgi:hypothetical protein
MGMAESKLDAERHSVCRRRPRIRPTRKALLVPPRQSLTIVLHVFVTQSYCSMMEILWISTSGFRSRATETWTVIGHRISSGSLMNAVSHNRSQRMLATRDAWSSINDSWLLGRLRCTETTVSTAHIERVMTATSSLRYPPHLHLDSRNLLDEVRGRWASSAPTTRSVSSGTSAARACCTRRATNQPDDHIRASRPLIPPLRSCRQTRTGRIGTISTTTTSATGPSPAPPSRTTMTVRPSSARCQARCVQTLPFAKAAV